MWFGDTNIDSSASFAMIPKDSSAPSGEPNQSKHSGSEAHVDNMKQDWWQYRQTLIPAYATFI